MESRNEILRKLKQRRADHRWYQRHKEELKAERHLYVITEKNPKFNRIFRREFDRIWREVKEMT